MFESIISDLKKLLPSYKLKKEKDDIRTILKQKRRLLTDQEITQCSQEVINQLSQSSLFQKAKTVMIYYPIQNEINLLSLFELYPDKTFLLPVTHHKSIEVRQYTGQDNLSKGKFGIPEPTTPQYKGKIDLIIVPGVAFDHHGYRLGRGGGYYDRFLSSLKRSKRIGVGYGFQLITHVPHNRHDQKMDEVIVSM